MTLDLPLNGVRVVDLSRVFAMPYTGGFLADLGAEVIRVEACHLPDSRLQLHALPENTPGEDWWERSGTFHTLNRGKRSLTLDLRNEDAQHILKDLIAISDITIENYTPRVTRRFGLDYQNLKNGDVKNKKEGQNSPPIQLTVRTAINSYHCKD